MKKKVLCPICDFVFVFVQNFTLDNKTIKTGSLYCLIAWISILSLFIGVVF